MEKEKIAVKPPTELEKQVEILKNRGLFFDNDTEAIRTLEHINYYRLRGYYIHLQKEDVFEKGVSFNQIIALHNFDSELRLLLLSVLLDVEIVARARILYPAASQRIHSGCLPGHSAQYLIPGVSDLPVKTARVR